MYARLAGTFRNLLQAHAKAQTEADQHQPQLGTDGKLVAADPDNDDDDDDDGDDQSDDDDDDDDGDEIGDGDGHGGVGQGRESNAASDGHVRLSLGTLSDAMQR